MNEVISILMRRDGLTMAEALDLVDECREALEMGNPYAIQEYLGLENDYIFDILG